MCILGAVLTDKVIVQPLTDFVWLGGNFYDMGNQHFIGRLFRSLFESFQELDDYYKSLSPSDTLLRERMFPYVRSYNSEDPEGEVFFTYLRPLAGRKPIFLAQLDDETKVVVKFVQTYSSVGHKLLAAEELAPRLLYCGVGDPSARFFGQMKMVVMEYIEGLTAYDAMKKGKLGLGVYESVERGLELLHGKDLVFGDLRTANIIIKQSKDGQDLVALVDFDWCSIEGQGRYPPNLNQSATSWHAEVEGNGVMRKVHDLVLLNSFRDNCV